MDQDIHTWFYHVNQHVCVCVCVCVRVCVCIITLHQQCMYCTQACVSIITREATVTSACFLLSGDPDYIMDRLPRVCYS